MTKHKNDFYAELSKDNDNKPAAPAINAATVLLLRENAGEMEVLLLKKTSKITFGGMWVFPGGRIDEADYQGGSDDNAAARNAAARETMEEAGITIPHEKFVWFSHWMPPPKEGKRFSTWFFITASKGDQKIEVDGGEIQEHQWISPRTALAKHALGELDLVPPTWVSLYHLSKFSSVDEAMAALRSAEPRFYRTHMAKNADGVRVTIWEGDAGYEDSDADRAGETHRLLMHKEGFEFLHSAVEY